MEKGKEGGERERRGKEREGRGRKEGGDRETMTTRTSNISESITISYKRILTIVH